MRVLVLSSDTGGGHRASAHALRAALHALYPGLVCVDIVDFWVEFAEGPFAHFPTQYTFLATHPWMWKLTYELTRFPPARAVSETVFNALAHRKVRDAFARYAPDLIVSVHPLVNTLSQKVLRHMAARSGLPPVPYVTVVTDLAAAHPTWFHRAVDMTYVPTDGVRAVAARVGLPPTRLRQLGLPVREDFWHPAPDKDAMRARLGMRTGIPAVLAVGGGDGVGGLRGIAEALCTLLPEKLGGANLQVVVICGKNNDLRSWLASRTWPCTVKPLGYVNNMSDWMAASDIICTKAGPGTIAEALIRGLPTIITGFLPGQEEANVKYVVDQRVGAFARKPSKIAHTAAHWLSNPHLLAQMSDRARACGRPHASLEIAEDIMQVAKAKIMQNMETMERQRLLREAAQHALTRNHLAAYIPNAVMITESSRQSHLVFRVRFMLRVIFGGLLAHQALGGGSSTPPASPSGRAIKSSEHHSDV